MLAIRRAPPPQLGNVILFLEFDGNFNDSGPLSKTPQSSTNVEIDTANKKFGSGSAKPIVRGDPAIIQYASSEDFNWVGQDVTIDFWIYVPSSIPAGAQQYVFANNATQLTYIQTDNVAGAATKFVINFANQGGLGSGVVSAQDLPLDTWLNIAYSYSVSDAKTRIFVDGVKVTEFDLTQFLPLPSPSSDPDPKPFGIFGIPNRSDLPSFSGNIDSLKIIKGFAKS
jgi:hypothetical protein